MTKRSPPYFPEVRERAVRMIFDHQGEHGSQWSAIQSITAKIGCWGETLRNWIRQAERDRGVRAGPTSDERIKVLEREVRGTPVSKRLDDAGRCAPSVGCRAIRRGPPGPFNSSGPAA